MKISLILFLCSYTASTCMPGFEYPTKFNDMYDCLNAGYTESIKKIDEIGREEINKSTIFVKFACAAEITDET